MSERRESGKLIKATGLWRKTSAAGNEYLTGRWGALRVLIMPNRDKATDADPTHVLLIGEAGERKPTGGSEGADERGRQAVRLAR